MIQIYLPIAEVSVNLFVLMAIGGGVGFLSGLFGVGGGFLMTPLLIFIGIPPAIAVGSEANQLAAASLSGVIAHWRGGRVDLRMGIMLLIGGLIGSTLGVSLFAWLRATGQVDLVIKLLYVVLLSTIGTMMMVESLRANLKSRRQSGENGSTASADNQPAKITWRQRLPWQMAFPTSGVTISALLPLTLGIIIGVLAAIMGIGGGFIMVPAMIYLLGMPTAIVVGTSLFQILFVASNVTLQQAIRVQTVDVVLALLLMAGSVLGAQIGVRAGAKLKGEELRFLLALIVLVVCGWMVFNLISEPVELFTMVTGGGH